MSIRVEDLSYVYQAGTVMEARVFAHLNFEIKDGEFIGLIGHTGCGKSTLIQHFNGLYRPTGGTVYYNGEDIFQKGYDLKKLRSKVGMVFQYPEYQLFEETVLKDVMFGPLNMGLSEEEAKARAEEALRLTGLSGDCFDDSPFELSGGQKRRAAIAGVLSMQPEVLILDEPAAGLDPAGRDEILGIAKSLKEKQNMTIILVSHSMDDVAEYADRIMVLDSGSLAFFDTPKEVFRHQEELLEMGLSVPQMTHLAKLLNESGLLVDPSVSTIPETKAEILRLLSQRNGNGSF